MTSFVRRVAGGLTIVEALWLIFSYFDVSRESCSAGGCPGPQFIPTYSIVAPALALLLLAVGALGVWGASLAYKAGMALSLGALLVFGYSVVVVSGFGYLSATSNDAIIGVALALVGLLGNVSGDRSKDAISEQANPMNLPVFG